MCGLLALTVPILSSSSCLSRCQFLNSGNCHQLKNLRWSTFPFRISSVRSAHPSELPGTKFYPPGPVLHQELFLLHQTPRTNFLVPSFDPELACSPHCSSPGQIILLQASINFLTILLLVFKGNGFLLCIVTLFFPFV